MLFLLPLSMDLNVKVKECRDLNKEGNNYGSDCCYKLVANETVLISEDII